jgi:hypothetical protein
MLAAQAATKKHLQLKDASAPTVFSGASHNISNSQQ